MVLIIACRLAMLGRRKSPGGKACCRGRCGRWCYCLAASPAASCARRQGRVGRLSPDGPLHPWPAGTSTSSRSPFPAGRTARRRRRGHGVRADTRRLPRIRPLEDRPGWRRAQAELRATSGQNLWLARAYCARWTPSTSSSLPTLWAQAALRNFETYGTCAGAETPQTQQLIAAIEQEMAGRQA
jgi:hypothetical protein